MGNELATIGGAVSTAATATAAGVTFGQIPAVNGAVQSCAVYTARNARDTGWRHVGEAAGSAVATAACVVAAGATLGQVDGVNRAVASCAENTGRASIVMANRTVASINGLNIVNDLSKVCFVQFARDLPNHNIRRWLARSARDCYNEHTFSGQGLFAKVYALGGKKCLAIRGTASVAAVAQDILMYLSEAYLSPFVDTLERWARQLGVHYVTGHSLGGFLAEAVASRLGLDGASFNGPGGRGILTCFGNCWSTTTRFEVHLHEADSVSLHMHERHIAEPKWHRFPGPNWHSIKNMASDIEHGRQL